jgi:hypothetical protein
MSMKRAPLPKSQAEISAGLRDQVAAPALNRGTKTAATTSTPKPFTVGLEDIDTAMMYYFENVIRPSVFQNSVEIKVPVLYGSPERWSSMQKQGHLRDHNDKLMTPLIMFKRTNMEKLRNITNKLDANAVNNFVVSKSRYNIKNAYSNFSALNGITNRSESQKIILSVVPDYVRLTYSCIIFTDYIEQLNKLQESINYASDSYWGDPNRFKFNARIDSFPNSTSLETGVDRVIRSEFTISMFGYIIPDAIIKDLSYDRIIYSPARVNFTYETTGSL